LESDVKYFTHEENCKRVEKWEHFCNQNLMHLDRTACNQNRLKLFSYFTQKNDWYLRFLF